jgi:hypothetical protein
VTVIIEKNVPVPQPWGRWTKIAAAMEVGDSVLVPHACFHRTTSLGMALRRMGFGSKQRQEDGGIRVWRTK